MKNGTERVSRYERIYSATHFCAQVTRNWEYAMVLSNESFYLKRLIKVGAAVSSSIKRLTLACSVWFDFKPVHMISYRRK